jgi:hypothetical protein
MRLKSMPKSMTNQCKIYAQKSNAKNMRFEENESKSEPKLMTNPLKTIKKSMSEFDTEKAPFGGGGATPRSPRKTYKSTRLPTGTYSYLIKMKENKRGVQ